MPGFPADRDPAKVKAWRARNIRTRELEKKKPPPPDFTISDPPRAPWPDLDSSPAFSTDDPIIKDMLDGEPLAVSRAAVRIASRRVAHSAMNRTFSPNELDGLKKALQELRAAESGYIALEESKRNLLPRPQVETLVREMVGRLVRVLSLLETAITSELALWLASDKVRGMKAEERGRMVREFVNRTCREVRQLEADGASALIDRKPS